MSQAATTERPVRIAVVGAGLIGRAHVRRILDEPAAALAGIVDPMPQGHDFAHGLGAAWFADIEALLRAERPDGMVIATPNQLHVAHALAAVGAGIPALLEKPVADDLDSAWRLVAAAEAAGVPILVGHHRRHSPLIQRAKAIVASGRLGRVVAVNGMCWFLKPADYFDVAWRRQPGGGVVLINLIHVIDDLRNICGDIVRVQAARSSAARGFPVEDTAAILLQFRDGALGTLTLSDTAAAPWSWEMTSGENKAYPFTDQSCYMIGGTAGSLTVPRLELWHHGDGSGWWAPIHCERMVVPEQDPLVLQLRHFCDVVRGTAKPVPDVREGTRTLETTLAVTQAAATGAVVTLS